MLLKLLLVAASALLSSLVAKRFGHAVGGTLAGLPMIAGPIMGFVLWATPVEGVRAIALATLVCLPATVAHLVSFAWSGTRWPWWLSLALANLAFFGLGMLMPQLGLPAWLVCLLALAVLALGGVVMPRLRIAPGAVDIPHAELYMRSEGDYRPDYVIKSQILDAILADGYEIAFVVDDRPSVVAMWRERGLVCLQCREWEEAPAREPGLLSLMVGPSGAGKSTWLNSFAAKERGIHPSQIVSSDQIRVELCGDFRDQTRNEEVFAALHAVVKVRVAHGIPTVVDATNLRRKDRLAVAGARRSRLDPG